MSKLINLKGKLFGRWTVIRKVRGHYKNSKRKRIYWWCRCECGKVVATLADNLRRGTTKSCGCLSNIGFSGRKHTEATKRLMSKSHHGQSGADHPNWEGGKSFIQYPEGWITLRDEIRKRDGYKCRLCGVPQMECIRKLDVHHKDGNKHNLRPENLVSLCMSCHHGLHWKICKRMKVGQNNHERGQPAL